MQWTCGGRAGAFSGHAVGTCYLLRPLPERLQETEQALSCYIPFLNTASVYFACSVLAQGQPVFLY